MKVSKYFIFSILAFSPYCITAQQAAPSDTLLNHMTGKWLFSGMIAGTSVKHTCLWLDNTSNEGLSNGIIAHTPFEANKIALLFRLKDNAFFHTTFSYRLADDSWHWEMTDDENGKKDSFADAVMVRIP